jgi:hypothetical protein
MGGHRVGHAGNDAMQQTRGKDLVCTTSLRCWWRESRWCSSQGSCTLSCGRFRHMTASKEGTLPRAFSYPVCGISSLRRDVRDGVAWSLRFGPRVKTGKTTAPGSGRGGAEARLYPRISSCMMLADVGEIAGKYSASRRDIRVSIPRFWCCRPFPFPEIIGYLANAPRCLFSTD